MIPLFWASGAPAAFVISASANIAASGEATTAQLTPPATKTTGDFDPGRIQDDENPTDPVNIGNNRYSEFEWPIKAVGTQVVNGEVYEFRVVRHSTSLPLDVYTLTPQWTIATGAAGVVPYQPGYLWAPVMAQ